jgi:phosphoserine aminotransferase
MRRAINFNAGPAGLPLPALERAQRELIDFENTGMSILEHSHRGKAYEAVHKEAMNLVRELLAVPDDYHVLFLQGGASQQFATVPMNFLPQGKSADYIVTGGWSEKAVKEAKVVGQVKIAATTEVEKKYTRVPKQEELKLDPDAAYVHYTTNNTLFGTQFHYLPEVSKVPLVADMSSDFMWKKFDVSKYALVYAGAQKNIGPSGVVVVIAKKDFVASGRKDIPTIFKYSTHAENDSLYNTAPTFGIYLIRNVLAYLKEKGGLEEVERNNKKKADTLYGALDSHASYYKAPVEKGSRSTMNVVFHLPSEELEKKFVAEAAKEHQMVGLAGHRSTGGIRASIYNAVSLENVETLVAFMEEFEKKNG